MEGGNISSEKALAEPRLDINGHMAMNQYLLIPFLGG